MPSFAYTARDRTGRSQAGSVEAPSRRDALRILQTRGLQPVNLAESAAPAPGSSPTPAGTATPAKPGAPVRKIETAKLTRSLRLPFLQALAELIRSGMSAGEAVRLLAKRLKEPKLRTLCSGIWSRLGEGRSLSGALADYPAIFDGQTVNLVSAGEATGNLREALDRLIEYFTEQRELRQQVLAAMAYPVFICFLAGGVILFFLFFLLPRLQTLLASLGGGLPFSTRLLVSFSEFLLHYGIFLLGGGIAAAIALWRWRRTPAGRSASDAFLVRLPVTGAYIVRATVLNFTQTLAVLLENGITTAEALRLAERTVDNTALRAALHEATDRVLEGEALASALARTQILPDLVTDRLAVGEQTGNLAPSLRDLARSYQADLRRWLQRFTQLISGGVLVFAFSFVAFIAYAIVSAVFKVSSSFKF